jgi:hypothetical protein
MANEVMPRVNEALGLGSVINANSAQSEPVALQEQ